MTTTTRIELMPATRTRASELLGELSVLVAAENVAVRKLDHDALVELAAKKLEVTEALKALGAASFDQNDKQQLEQIRAGALQNQLLLVHARDTVRQVLDQVAGRSGFPSSGGMRLDLRG
jgi:hypothetical protein